MQYINSNFPDWIVGVGEGNPMVHFPTARVGNIYRAPCPPSLIETAGAEISGPQMPLIGNVGVHPSYCKNAANPYNLQTSGYNNFYLVNDDQRGQRYNKPCPGGICPNGVCGPQNSCKCAGNNACSNNLN